MKIKLLLFSFLFTSYYCVGQVVAGHLDNFEDGTVQGWNIDLFGAGAPNPPININTGGPAGVDDNFLQYTTTGNPGGPGSKMIVFQFDSNWMGNYTSQSIVAIKLDVKAEASNINLRVAFNGDGGEMCTTNAIVIPAGSGWNSVTIPITSSDFTLVDGGSNVSATLANVTEMRILSSPTPAWRGQAFPGVPTTMGLDNITASTTLGVNEVAQLKDFKISPNPSKSKLNLILPASDNAFKLDVFDVLGKKILSKEVSKLSSSIDVSKWNNGVYLVRITSENGTQTKRSVKQ